MPLSLDELWKIVRSIPKGKVMAYGDVGRSLRYPVSGFQVGRWMARAPEGVPWWRVVSRTGQLPIAKRGEGLASEQFARLQQEGVPFVGDRMVDMETASWAPD